MTHTSAQTAPRQPSHMPVSEKKRVIRTGSRSPKISTSMKVCL